MTGKAQKTTPVRLTDEAIRWARIASGYTGESMAEYVSRIVAERGRQDVDRLHAHLATAQKEFGSREAARLHAKIASEPPKRKGGSK